MDTAKCYEAFGGNYDEVMQRLPSSALIEKFLKMFLEDTSYEELCSSMRNGSSREAFAAAHTLKGVSANLGMSNLFRATDLLTESLRNIDGNIPQESFGLFENVSKEYEMVAGTIRKFGNFS